MDQGIGAHTDAKIFGPVIVSVSLLQPTNMIFTHRTEPSKNVTLMPGIGPGDDGNSENRVET